MHSNRFLHINPLFYPLDTHIRKHNEGNRNFTTPWIGFTNHSNIPDTCMLSNLTFQFRQANLESVLNILSRTIPFSTFFKAKIAHTKDTKKHGPTENTANNEYDKDIVLSLARKEHE